MSETGRAWSWRHAILDSDLPPTTRHVLLTLSCFMNDVGTGAYPTQETLAEKTGLSTRAIRTHLELAETKGWLKRDEHGFRGQRWRSTEYWALWPDPLHIEKGAEPGSAPSGERCGTSFQKVRNDVPTILPDNITPLAPTGGETTQTQDVGGRVHVNALLDEALYRACCTISGHKASMVDKQGGWSFPRMVVEEAMRQMGAQP